MGKQELVEEITEEVVEEEIEEVEEVEDPEETDIEDEVAEKKPWEDDSDEESVPLTALLKTKRKFQGRVEERDTEIEALKLENQNLRNSAQPPPVNQPLKRPRERDFDTDEEYDVAQDAWDAQNLKNMQDNVLQTNAQNIQQEQTVQDIGRKLDKHYANAESFCEEQSIDLTVYKAADSKVREAVEAIRPQQGNQTVDLLISKLGDDSEKVMLCLGNNKKNLLEFQNSLINDPTGLETMRLMGRIEGTIKPNKKLTSQARKPARSANGDAQPKVKSSAEKKKFDEAEKNGNIQAMFNIKQGAKNAGVDVKNWS